MRMSLRRATAITAAEEVSGHSHARSIRDPLLEVIETLKD